MRRSALRAVVRPVGILRRERPGFPVQRELVAEILKLAGDDSPLAGLSREEVGAVDGGLCDLGNPERRADRHDYLAL